MEPWGCVALKIGEMRPLGVEAEREIEYLLSELCKGRGRFSWLDV